MMIKTKLLTLTLIIACSAIEVFGQGIKGIQEVHFKFETEIIYDITNLQFYDPPLEPEILHDVMEVKTDTISSPELFAQILYSAKMQRIIEIKEHSETAEVLNTVYSGESSDYKENAFIKIHFTLHFSRDNENYALVYTNQYMGTKNPDTYKVLLLENKKGKWSTTKFEKEKLLALISQLKPEYAKKLLRGEQSENKEYMTLYNSAYTKKSVLNVGAFTLEGLNVKALYCEDYSVPLKSIRNKPFCLK